MANRRVRLVRSVKLNGVWKFLNPIKAQRLRIANSEGRWYISWREGSKKKWQKADSWSHAMQLQHKKEAELHAIAAGAAGFRVEQGVNSTDSIEYLYDLSGNEVAGLVPGTTNLYTAELFDNGRHWATFNGDAKFLHTDWLGTLRATTNLSGSAVQQCTDLPFGDDLGCTSSLSQYMGISGSFLDSYDNLDHFLYRQYTGNEGRWISPDPAGLMAANPAHPQTWNRYTYVANNPLSFVDPSGLLLIGPIGTVGSTIDGSALNPMGDGSIWSSALNGTLITTPVYGWIPFGGPDDPSVPAQDRAVYLFAYEDIVGYDYSGFGNQGQTNNPIVTSGTGPDEGPHVQQAPPPRPPKPFWPTYLSQQSCQFSVVVADVGNLDDANGVYAPTFGLIAALYGKTPFVYVTGAVVVGAFVLNTVADAREKCTWVWQ